MTLEDLKYEIESLVGRYGEDVLNKEVYAVSDYGDRSHTQQLVPLDEGMELVQPRVTGYSQSGLALQNGDYIKDTGLGEVIVFGARI